MPVRTGPWNWLRLRPDPLQMLTVSFPHDPTPLASLPHLISLPRPVPTAQGTPLALRKVGSPPRAPLFSAHC